MSKRLVFIGDSFLRTMKNENPFSEVVRDFSGASFVVNCETLMTANTNSNKINRAVDVSLTKSSISQSAVASVQIFNLANNHSLDYDHHGLLNMEEYLLSREKEIIGTLRHPYVNVQCGKYRIAILGMLALPVRRSKGLINRKNFSGFLDELNLISDFLIVNIHWGIEYTDFPSPKERNFARSLVRNYGVDCIIGHHPHIMQGKEVIDKSIIYYSLGNGNFATWQNKYSHWSRISLVVSLSFDNDKIVAEEYFYNIDDNLILSKPSDVELKEIRLHFKNLSHEVDRYNWFSFGVEYSSLYLKQEKEALKKRWDKNHFSQIPVFLYWFFKKRTLYFIFCFLWRLIRR